MAGDKMKELFKKLLEIKKEIPYFKKSTQGYNFQYVNGADILGVINPIANKYGLMLTLSINNHTVEPIRYKSIVKGKDGAVNEVEKLEFIVNGTLTYTWTDTETGNQLPLTFPFTGMQADPSQALGSALTYTERYFFLKSFNIETDKDDPDARTKKLDKLTGEDDLKEIQERIKNGLDKCKELGLSQTELIVLGDGYGKCKDYNKLVEILSNVKDKYALLKMPEATPELTAKVDELMELTKTIKFDNDEEKESIIDQILKISNEKDYKVMEGMLKKRVDKTNKPKPEPVKLEDETILPTADEIDDLQNRIEKGLNLLKTNKVDKYDNAERVKNSKIKHLGCENVSECQDYDKLNAYRDYLVNKFNEFKETKTK